MKVKGRPTTRKRPKFGARLAAIRNDRGVTQLGLALKLRVDRSLIRYYERDTNDPKLSFVIRCSKALGVPLSQLVGPSAADLRGVDAGVARLARRLMALNPRRRTFILRLFSRQLTELNRDSLDQNAK